MLNCCNAIVWFVSGLLRKLYTKKFIYVWPDSSWKPCCCYYFFVLFSFHSPPPFLISFYLPTSSLEVKSKFCEKKWRNIKIHTTFVCGLFLSRCRTKSQPDAHNIQVIELFHFISLPLRPRKIKEPFSSKTKWLKRRLVLTAICVYFRSSGI